MSYKEGVEIMLLGTAQDGGVPHMACKCVNCAAAKLSNAPQYAASMALISHDSKQAWLIDASPDVKPQYDALTSYVPGYTFRGVLLTHLHMGHYIGLYQFGREAAKAKQLEIHATASAGQFFTSNQPWRSMLEDKVLQLSSRLVPGESLKLTDGLSVTPLKVPHRAEYSDAVAMMIQGPIHRAFYCPDIDSWAEWEHDIAEVVSSVHVAFLDSTFWSPAELGRRDMGEIPHPLVPDTLARLAGWGQHVILIHLNHTNPVWKVDSEERREVESKGFTVGTMGRTWTL